MIGEGVRAPLFILSFAHRDTLAEWATQAGWDAIAARRADGAVQRLTASGAKIAVVDLRDAIDDGVAAIARLAAIAEAQRGALLALVPAEAPETIARAYAGGATHYLAAPFDEPAFAQTLRFMTRFVARLEPGRAPDPVQSRPAWRWRPGGRPVELDPAARRLLRLPAEGAVHRGALVGKLDRGQRRDVIQAISRARNTAAATAFAIPDARSKGRLVHHLRADPASGAVVGRIEEISGAAAARPSGFDVLTQLADAASGRERLAAALAEAPGTVTVLLVGLSRFDAVNAAFGRLVGDALLRAAARRIGRAVAADRAKGAFAIRTAGAEFAVMLPGGARDPAVVAGTIVDLLGRPFVVGEQLIPLSARIGIARDEGGGADRLLHRARTALDIAREQEGERIGFASGAAESAAAAGLEIDLRVALTQDRIDILFQPQVAIASGAIVGVEALARWRHETLGEIEASTLFAVAARSDYSLQLSAHIQQRAIEAVAAWPAGLAHLRVAINVIAADLSRPALVDDTVARARAAGVDPRRLTLELTEESLVADLSTAVATLAGLRAAGLKVAIDDFGTGYSSLAYLKSLPLDYLKIDRSLAQDIAGSARDRIVVRGVIEMARSLDLAVIAEGVETQEQLALLAAEGCNFYQGFLCATPLDTDALVALIGGA